MRRRNYAPSRKTVDNLLTNGRVMLQRSSQVVELGDSVLVAMNGGVKELEIVDIPDANPSKGKISFLSPLGKALFGKKFPERVVVALPNGETMECQLLKITHH